jgi:hypothetical protein
MDGWRQQGKSREAMDGRRYRGEEAAEAERIRPGADPESGGGEDWVGRIAKLLHEGILKLGQSKLKARQTAWSNLVIVGFKKRKEDQGHIKRKKISL